MTISTTASKSILSGNGVTTAFSFNFIAADASDIEVTYTDATGVATTLTSTQYTLSLNAAAVGQIWGIGGTVTYPIVGSPIASGTTLTISRVLPLTQTITISNQGDFAPQVIEEMGDTLEMQIQQIAARTGQFRGTWVTNTAYSFGDIVQDGVNGASTGSYYMCVIANTSGVWATDIAAGDWTLVIQSVPPSITLPVSIANGGTGASTAAGARTNLGVPALASGNTFTSTNVFTSLIDVTSGIITVATQSPGDNTTKASSTAFVTAALAASGAIKSVKAQQFTSNASYTPSAGMIYALCEVWGGGGGGGGITAVAGACAAGGASGGYARKTIAAASIGVSKAVIIGAGGTAGANSGGTGGTGGTTSIGALLQATGGTGGQGSTSATISYNGGTVPGVGSGGDINATGQPGGSSVGSASVGISGAGGATTLGGNGQSYGAQSSNPGNDAVANSGSGGSGAQNGASAGARIGGVGGSGFVSILEFCTQ